MEVGALAQREDVPGRDRQRLVEVGCRMRTATLQAVHHADRGQQLFATRAARLLRRAVGGNGKGPRFHPTARADPADQPDDPRVIIRAGLGFE